jgi:hypothetical protein
VHAVRSRLALTVAGIALVAAACGSSAKHDAAASPTTSSAAPAPAPGTRAAFIAQADAVCEKYATARNAALFAIQREHADQAGQAAAFVKNVVPIQRKEVEELRALTPPAADAAQINKLWDAVDAGTSQAEQVMRTDPAKALASTFDPYGPSNRQAEAYGFQVCGT